MYRSLKKRYFEIEFHSRNHRWDETKKETEKNDENNASCMRKRKARRICHSITDVTAMTAEHERETERFLGLQQ